MTAGDVVVLDAPTPETTAGDVVPHSSSLQQRQTTTAHRPPNTVTDAGNWAKAISVAIVDVIAGRRDARSIQRWVAPKVYARLAPLVADNSGSGSSLPAVAMAARTCVLPTGTVEFAVTVWDRNRARAVAGRLVVVRGRWLVTELETH